MASDDAYMDFLNKANADHSAGQKDSTQGAKIRTVDESLKVPSSLQQVEAYYVSESDEPFEPVVLRFKGAAKGEWPSAGDLSSLISPDTDISGQISTLDTSSFDPRNEYSKVLQAVSEATEESNSADIKVYRVERSKTTVEYYVLALDSADGGRIVGLVAKSVET
ncbi:hypothetical protein N7451_009636 [Penicillium sp. IBT 35674x]|nr:hypothetical protein N7451_009636 [Penicillium sp. IBT 35674x]